MAIKIDPRNIDHALELLKAGHSIAEISLAAGICKQTLRKLIRARGLALPTSQHVKQLPDQEIVRAYLDGASELELSKRYKVARGSIRKRLIKHGVEPRDQSTSGFVSASRMTVEQRQQRARAANDVVRRDGHSLESLRKRAISAERSRIDHRIGVGEQQFCELLAQRGIEAIWQKAVDIYNIDVACGSVAVELRNGARGSHGRDVRRGRTEKIVEAGYAVLYIHFDELSDLLGNFEYLVAEIERARSDPPAGRQYRVVRCRTERFARLRGDDGKFAAVATPPQPLATCREFDF